MNKIYKVVWSKVKNCYVVVSEVAKNIITGGVKSAKIGSAPMAKGLALGAAMAFVITGSAMAASYSDIYTSDSDPATNRVGAYGSGLHFGESDVTLTDSVYKGNKSTASGAHGGAVRVQGNLNVEKGIFINNSITGGSGKGGAIAHQDGLLTVKESVFESNKTTYRGAAIYANNSSEGSTISNSQFKNNAEYKSNGKAFGGAVVYLQNGSNVTLNGNVFDGNIAAAVILDESKLVLEGENQFLNNKSNAIITGTNGGTVTFAGGSNTLFKGNSSQDFGASNDKGTFELESGANVVAETGIFMANGTLVNNGGNLELGLTSAVKSDGSKGYFRSTIGTLEGEGGTIAIDSKWFDVAGDPALTITKNDSTDTVIVARDLDLKGGAKFALKNVVDDLKNEVSNTGNELIFATAAVDSVLRGDVELKDGKVTTTMDTDNLVVAGTVNGVDMSDLAGLDRTADSEYYQSTTIEGKTTIDSMGRVYTNHVFADQAIVVGDHSTLDSTGLYVGKNFKVNKETGDVEAGKVNGAEISDYKFNGVTLDKDGDVFAKDIMATGYITSLEGITSLKGIKAAGGKFVVDGTTGMVRTEGNIFTKNGVTVFDYVNGTGASVAIQKDGIYASNANGERTFTVDSKTGDVEAGKVNGAEISDYKFNGVTLDKDGDVFAKDIMATGYITSLEGITSLKGIKAAGGKFVVDAATGNVTGGTYNGVNVENLKDQVDANIGRIENVENRVTENEFAISQNKQDIATNAEKIETNNGLIAENRDAIADNAFNIETNKQAIEANKDAIEANKDAIEANKDAIEANKDAIAANKDAIEANKQAIETNKADIAANKQAIADEAAAREAADKALSDAIDNVAGDIADTKAQVEANKEAIEVNKDAIKQNAQDIENEVAARQEGDNKLQANLDKESVDRQIADAQERAERAQADQKLQANIDAEAQARKDADAQEAQIRSNEDQRIEQKFDGEVNRLDNRIDKVDAKIDKVGAMAAAMASLKTMGYDPEAPTEIAVGVGQYRNETGLAIGAFHYPNKNFMLNFSLSTAGDEVMGGVGATWKIGRKKPAGETMEDKVAKAEAMKEAAKAARVKAQQAKHAKMLAEKSK